MNQNKFNWKKWLPITGGALIILVFLAYFIITSSFFLTKVALPIAGNILKIEIKADSVKLSGLSKVDVKGLKVTPQGEETILEAGEVMAELNKLDLSFASFSIKEVYLDKGLVNIVQTPDGGNLAALLELFGGEKDTNKPPMALQVDKVAVKDSIVKWKMIGADNSVMGADMEKVNVSGEGIGTELSGKLNMTTDLSYYMGSNYKVQPEQHMGGSFQADLVVPLTKEMMPGIISGPVKWDFSQTRGMFAMLQGEQLALDLGLSLSEIQKLVVDLNKGSESLAKVAVNGTLDMSDMSALLNYEVSNVDNRLLNTLSDMTGVKFEKTFISSKGSIQAADSLNTYILKAQSQLKDVTVLTGETSSLPLSLDSDVDLTVDLQKQSITLAKLHGKGIQADKEFVVAEITKPMVVSWGEGVAGADDSSLHVKLNLDLATWRDILSDTNASGILGGTVDLNVKNSGTQVGLNSELTLDKINAKGIQANGAVKVANDLAITAEKIVLAGNVGVENLTVGLGTIGITNFVLKTDYDLNMISTNSEINLNAINVSFASTEKAKNAITVNGKIDFSNAEPSNLNVVSEGIDLTPLMKWVQALTATEPGERIAKAEEAAVENKAETEIAAVETHQLELPIKDFTGKIKIQSVFANTIQVKDIDTTLTIKNENVALDTGAIHVVCGNEDAAIQAKAQFNLNDFSAGVSYDVSGIEAGLVNELLAVAGIQDMALEKVFIAVKGDASASEKLTVFDLKTQTNVKDLKIAHQSEMPVVSLEANLDVNANIKQELLKANIVSAKGLLGEKPFLVADLTKPMVVSWGTKAPEGVEDSALKVVLDLNLADWKALLRDEDAAGTVNGNIALSVGDSGNKVALDSKIALVSVMTAGMTASGDLQTKGSLVRADNNTSFEGIFKVENLNVENDSLAIKDFSTSTDYQIALTPDILNIKKLDIAWAPTERAKNQVSITGNIAYADLKEKPSRVSIVSESMDFTPMLSWMKSTATAGEAADAKTAETEVAKKDKNDHSLPLPKEEPDAIDLPIKDFECLFDFGVVYLKQIYASNVNANIFIRDNTVGFATKSLNINGGDVKASAESNLGVKGYTYSLNYDAPGIPAGPIFDLVAADIPGELTKGNIYADGNITGKGLTEKAIQKNLALQVKAGLTNVSFTPVSSTYRTVLMPILIPLRLNSLVNSPIMGVSADMKGADGDYTINYARVTTEAFEAEVTGEMKLEEVLMDTPLDLPVGIYLEQKVADKSNLTSSNARTNSVGFQAMPDFVKIVGTPAKPDYDIAEAKIAGLLLKSGAGIVGDAGSTANQVVGRVGGLLVGDTSNTNGVQGVVKGLGGLVGIGGKDSDGTNDVDNPSDGGTLKNVGKSIGNLFGGGKDGGSSTNTTSTNVPKKGLGGFLNGLGK